MSTVGGYVSSWNRIKKAYPEKPIITIMNTVQRQPMYHPSLSSETLPCFRPGIYTLKWLFYSLSVLTLGDVDPLLVFTDMAGTTGTAIYRNQPVLTLFPHPFTPQHLTSSQDLVHGATLSS